MQTYFDKKAQDSPETEDQLFGKMVGLEMAKIQDDVIKQRVKRRLLDVVYEGVDEYRQHSKPQPVPTVDVQYMVVKPDGSLQLLTSPELWAAVHHDCRVFMSTVSYPCSASVAELWAAVHHDCRVFMSTVSYPCSASAYTTIGGGLPYSKKVEIPFAGISSLIESVPD